MFSKGSYVIYRSEGVCVISDIRRENFNALGGEGEFYILNPINDMKSVVYVPVDNEVLTGMMRPILSAEEINKLCEEVREIRLELPPETRVRSLKLRELLSLGDRRELVILVNTLEDFFALAEEKGKKIGSTEKNAHARALKLLYDEFSYASDISDTEMLLAVIRRETECGDKAV